MTTHYTILGVDASADADTIKKAYRKLAMQYHPDRGGDQAKFQEIQQAYAILSDAQKRAEYDNPQQFNNGFNFNGGMPSGFEDVFSHFGNMFGGNMQQPQRNKTLTIQTTITLEDAFYGKAMLASITLPSGKDQTLDIKIPAGIMDGTTLRLTGLGDDSLPNMPRGDLHLLVHIVPHAIFRRQGNDLIKIVEVDCIQAILGKSVMVTTIDNKQLLINIAPGTQTNTILSAPGYGMPYASDTSHKGRMLMSINVTVPTDLTPEQLTLLKENFN